MLYLPLFSRCCLWCKDKNNKANHNVNIVFCLISLVVVYDAKIRIIKQITTNMLYLPLFSRCCLWCKDKNNKANHNSLSCSVKSPKVVVYDAKIRIIKQITTLIGMLFFYQCCCLWCKDKNNKANHNLTIWILSVFAVVVYDAKIRIIKQITTNLLLWTINWRLLFMMQR